MRRASIVAAVALTAGAAAAAAIVVGLPEAQGGGAAEAAMPPATAKVTRGTLVDEETKTGDLGYGDTTALKGRSSGTVTGLAATGSTVTRGKALYRVDDDPVVLLYGKLPAYRTLRNGVEGRDVKQLEQNLWALGYRGFTVDKEYTYATADAVEQWQDDLGVPETGAVEPAAVVYAAGPVRVDSHQIAAGDELQPGGGVLSTTGTARVGVVELEVDDQRLAKKGAKVQVTLPDGTETTATISHVETVVVPADNPDGEPTTAIDVTVTFPAGKAPKGLDAASIDVAFTAATADNVLTVPVTALLALSEGGYGVEVVSGSATSIVAVKTGMFADGKVEVSGTGIGEGTVVGVPA
ncbi:peptidoglycan-binding domain-containing protein [Actinoplanes sp. NPDC051633]|uniref:peptidoglycan-binding domain-containing protein n=1 Tax=Actinoplanes sp. NPDC051633 TaxID=3155670 RepID=UPI00343594C3